MSKRPRPITKLAKIEIPMEVDVPVCEEPSSPFAQKTEGFSCEDISKKFYNNNPPIDTAALDAKYSKPELFGGFKVYFGKYKGLTFEGLLGTGDAGYVDWLVRTPAKLNNHYLLQKYINFVKTAKSVS